MNVNETATVEIAKIVGAGNDADVQNEYLAMILKISSISQSLILEKMKINGGLLYKILEVFKGSKDSSSIEFRDCLISEFDWITIDAKIKYQLKNLKFTG